MLHGASIFRVHNVRAAVQAVRMIAAVEQATAHGAEEVRWE
jgi:dihydropteroate synthase